MRFAVLGRLLLAAGALSCARNAVAPTEAVGEGSVSGLPAAGNLLQATTFDDGVSVPWMTSFSAPAEGSAEVEDGALCVRVVNRGKNRWDAQFRHRELSIVRGHAYTVRFKVWASDSTRIYAKVGMAGPPYGEYWNQALDIGREPQLYRGTFSMRQADDGAAELAFHIGGGLAKAPVPFKVCIDDVALEDPEFKAPAARAKAAPVPNVLVNQLGYVPAFAKIASVKTSSASPLDWRLLDTAGKPVAQGKTSAFGKDAASGDDLQLVDFSSFSSPGRDYRLEVAGSQSYPFDVAQDVYAKLKLDALSFFYQNRSGIEIRADLVQSPALARPAGHMSDRSVHCAADAGCDYALDVSGGWYDAGDHGKYVVNGGIALWTLQNELERAMALGGAAAELGDGKLRIPERGNGVPDILDEARYELEFLLKMQVPAGQPLAGMVHHKVHDLNWTGLGTAPHEDKQPRALFKPSTAATLNLAATAAQAARLWQPLDAAFAARCLKASELAWSAAKANPKLMASAQSNGGGAYDDAHVDDDFYWAAAELLASTGKAEYRKYVLASPHHRELRWSCGGHVASMNWGDTDALGTISLAVANGVEAGLASDARKQIAAAADRYLQVMAKQGYRTPLQPTAENGYTWGSNSFVVNNLIVLALAHDFSKERKYVDAVVTGMDYLLGRNPLGQSYVTGYGERPLLHPHHRFWAKQANAAYPSPPPGLLSGGPNSSLDDPYAKAAGLKGCAPEKCFVDHIEAYSVNEIAINWNAPLAWIAAWLDEKAHTLREAADKEKPR